MGDNPLRTPTHRSLGEPLPHQLANGTHAHLLPPLPTLINNSCESLILWDINPDFSELFPGKRQVAYVLLTRAPLAAIPIARNALPFDLHVLGLPLAFILSQDQTLHCIKDLCLLLKELTLGLTFCFLPNFSKNFLSLLKRQFTIVITLPHSTFLFPSFKNFLKNGLQS